MRRQLPSLPMLFVGALLLVLVGAGSALAAQDTSGPPDSSTCAACHEDRVDAFRANNPHAVLESPKWNKNGVEGGSCTSCHTGAAKHVEEGGGPGNIMAFGSDVSAADIDKACLTCHTKTHPRFASSPHAKAGVACTSCHQIHQSGTTAVDLLKAGPTTAADPADKLGPKSAVCANCHGDVFTQFKYNEHHRLREGILECTSCHNPHEPTTVGRLGGFKDETCLKCHADKGGPFIYEHGSVRVEGCTACHDPMGSPNRHLLKFQRVAELCYSCHTTPPSFHSRFTLETQCTECHSSIHGSNFSPFFLK